MSDLTNLEKRKLEKLLGMGSGYVLNFSNKTFAEFVFDCTGLDIFDSRYNYASGSKANRLRAFWQQESNDIVGKLMREMLDDSFEFFGPQTQETLKEECRSITRRLQQGGTVSRPSRDETASKEEQAALQRSQSLRQLKEDFFNLQQSPTELGQDCLLKGF